MESLNRSGHSLCFQIPTTLAALARAEKVTRSRLLSTILINVLREQESGTKSTLKSAPASTAGPFNYRYPSSASIQRALDVASNPGAWNLVSNHLESLNPTSALLALLWLCSGPTVSIYLAHEY